MPSVVQEKAPYGGDLAHKEKPTESSFVGGITDFTAKIVEPSGVPAVSGFTAVNGRSSTSPADLARTNGTLEHRRALDMQQNPKADQKSAPAQHSEDWPYVNGDHSRRATPPNQPAKDPLAASPHKRKRSSSGDFSASSLSSPADDGQKHKRLNGFGSNQSPASPAMSAQALPGTNANPPAQPTHGDYSSAHRRASSSFARNTSESVGSDGRLAETLHRDSQDGQPARAGSDARSGDERPATAAAAPTAAHPHMDPYPGEGSRTLLQDPKKRKRQFANRTKTGCQTCRRRKKKCDEGKPECANCRRGGFLCEGYLAKTPYKPSVNRGPVQIQSKDGVYNDQAHQAHAQHLAQPHHQPQLYHRHGPPRDSSSVSEQGAPPSEGNRARPIVVDDTDRQTPRNSWPSPWPDANIRPYPPHSQSSDYPPPPRTISQGYPDHPAPAPIAQRPPPPGPYSHPVNSNPTIATAQLALQHQSTATHAPPPPPPASYGPRQLPQERTEKEKMMAGENFKWRSAELLEEREQCKVHLWRFNNAAQNPTMGVSREERIRLFRTILEAPHVPRIQGKDIHVGSVGKDVIVEAPFMCDYGYNINIGDGVVIGTNCTIMDPCKVMIGPRTVIGPNCSLYGLDMPRDVLVRGGGLDSVAFGKDIVIEEDVFIGGNVTVLPGVRIGRGATIGAGSIVTKDIAPYTVLACKQHGRLDQLQVLWNSNRGATH